jgi:hypothetical protein
MTSLRPFVAAATDLLNDQSVPTALELDATDPLPPQGGGEGRGALCPTRVQPILEDKAEQVRQLYDAALVEISTAAPWAVARVETVWRCCQGFMDAYGEAEWRGDRTVSDDLRIALATAVDQLRPVLPAVARSKALQQAEEQRQRVEEERRRAEAARIHEEHRRDPSNSVSTPPPTESNPPPATAPVIEIGEGEFRIYGGAWTPLNGKKLAILKVFAERLGRGVSIATIRAKVWGERDDGGVDDANIRVLICGVRKAVREAIEAAGLDAEADPIPNMNRGHDEGHDTAWRLHIPIYKE